MNLKGYVIGNGMLSSKLNMDTTLLFAYNHAMISERLWQKAATECCKGATDDCPFHTFKDAAFCGALVKNVTTAVWTTALNPYDVYAQCRNEPQNPDPTRRENKTSEANFQPIFDKKIKAKPCLNVTAVDKQRRRSTSLLRPIHRPEIRNLQPECHGCLHQAESRNERPCQKRSQRRTSSSLYAW
ncbi:hypothetical protein L596_001164 [Steinernema carpocapsae]|nr:hypothetical protein L596_001164 [Steinernema carpocapsae]